MTTKDFTANVISASKVVPDGNFKDSKASGVWDINEALDLIKGGNWPNAANFNPSAFVDGLFSNYLYTGNGAVLDVTNNVDLTKGGLVWIKNRETTGTHLLWSSENTGNLNSTNTDALNNTSLQPTFNNDGFTFPSSDWVSLNENNDTFVSWTFREQPKFFDIVKYSGNGSAQTLSHNLGSTPGMMLVKRTDSAGNFRIFHRSLGETKALTLASTGGEATSSSYWNDTAPTSTQFTIGTDLSDSGTNNFTAFLFAHNDDDGGFGEPGDQDIIKCGSVTADSSGNFTESLGFEPQFILFKATDQTEGWEIFDGMRNLTAVKFYRTGIEAQSTAAEGSGSKNLQINADGFASTGGVSGNITYAYMAIRRGGMQTPSAASDVFAIDARTGLTPEYISGFPVDFALIKDSNTSSDWIVNTRLLGNTFMETNTTDAEASDSLAKFDIQNGIRSDAVAGDYGWMWARARGYFDVAAYTGNDTAGRTVAHNLGVAPEMMWLRRRDTARPWYVYHKNLDASNPAHKYMQLQETDAVADLNTIWNDTAPTSSVFTIGDNNGVNGNTATYVAYLFATVAGVSKVGSFTMVNSNGSLDVDCGFTNGSKFIILKRTNDTGHWLVVDTDRGITSGNDPYLRLDVTNAQNSSTELVNALSAGFTVQHNQGVADGDYIFYAIATDPS